MLKKFKLWPLACCGLMLAPAAFAVDLVGVHDLALKNDPRLQAAEYRREAAGENKTQAWSNLLPSLELSGSKSLGNSSTSISGTEISDVSTDTDRLGAT